MGQTAVLLVLGPIFAADFQPCSYGFRPKRDSHQALTDVARALTWGYTQVLDADLMADFDSIPHDRLLAAVARRVADRHILRLLTQWLRAPVRVERDDGKRATRGGQRTRRGTPQGGVISPLLANVYLHAFDTAWRAAGLERRWQARLVRYADDFVILGRQAMGQVQTVVAQQLQALGLARNPAKTRVLDARQAAFTFLGFTVRRVPSRRTERVFPLARPSRAACQRLRDAVKALTTRAANRRRDHGSQPGRTRMGRLLPFPALRPRLQRPPAVRQPARSHLPAARAPDPVVGVPSVPGRLPLRAARSLHTARCAVGCSSCVCLAVKVLGAPDAGAPHVRFDAGVLAFGHGRAREAPPDERGGNR